MGHAKNTADDQRETDAGVSSLAHVHNISLQSIRGKESLRISPAGFLESNWQIARFGLTVAYTIWIEEEPSGVTEKMFESAVSSVDLTSEALLRFSNWLGTARSKDFVLKSGVPGISFVSVETGLVAPDWTFSIRCSLQLSTTTALSMDFNLDSASVEQLRIELQEMRRVPAHD